MHNTLRAHFSQCLEQLDTVPVMYPNVFECNFVYSYMYAYIYSSSHHSGMRVCIKGNPQMPE